MIANKIRFLKACYQTDLRAVSLLNFFGKKATHQLLLDSFEPISGKVTEFPVSTEWAEKLVAHTAVYGKEKALYCGAIFLAGSTFMAGKKEKMLTPLYLYNCDLLEEDGIYYMAINAEEPIINPAIKAVFEENQQGVLETISDKLPKGYLNFDAVDKIEKTLSKYFPKINIQLLDLLPDLISKKEYERIKNADDKNESYSFLPMAGLCLLKKPIGSRGIINELEEMTYRNHYSKPIQILLGDRANYTMGQSLNIDHVPAILSQSQSAIVRDVVKYPLRMVVGPPGTGKSFTIAALAAEMLALGKSVLIATKNVEAAEVVANKIEHDLGLEEIVVRASKKGFRKAAQKRLENLSLGINTKTVYWLDVKKSQKDLTKLNDRISSIEDLIYQQHKRFLPDGEFLYEFSGTFFEKLKKRWLQYQHDKKAPIWDLFNELETLISKKNKLLKKYILQYFYFFMDMGTRTSRDDLKIMARALKARTGNKKSAYFDETNLKKILKALPIWTVCMADVHKILPLYAGLFDLVIIDEASQCDMASCLPVLQRGKSAVVVGDPKQLRHLSFLSYQQQLIFKKQYGISDEDFEDLNYRDNSLLDLVDELISIQNSVYYLDEHYRSMPDIISFSNKHFYSNSLHIMTKNLNSQNRTHNFIEEVNGKRTARGNNAKEADYIFSEIKKIINLEKKLQPEYCQSIGIVSPFRDQVNHLQRKAEKLLTAEQIERHKVMIGTPFSFQGEERDIMFISFALDKNSHRSAFQYLNKSDVFNVCVTRARIKQVNCISFPIVDLKNNSLLAKYLSHTQSQNAVLNSFETEIPKDPFISEIKDMMVGSGVDDIFIGYEVAGVKIDLLVVKYGMSYGIDLAGYPGEYEEVISLDNWKMIYRTGIPVFYLPYSDWVFNRRKTELALKSFIRV